MKINYKLRLKGEAIEGETNTFSKMAMATDEVIGQKNTFVLMRDVCQALNSKKDMVYVSMFTEQGDHIQLSANWEES